MNPDLIAQLVALANTLITAAVGAIALLARREAAAGRREGQERDKSTASSSGESVTMTGVIRVLRYLDHVAESRRGKHEGMAGEVRERRGA